MYLLDPNAPTFPTGDVSLGLVIGALSFFVIAALVIWGASILNQEMK